MSWWFPNKLFIKANFLSVKQNLKSCPFPYNLLFWLIEEVACIQLFSYEKKNTSAKIILKVHLSNNFSSSMIYIHWISSMSYQVLSFFSGCLTFPSCTVAINLTLWRSIYHGVSYNIILVWSFHISFLLSCHEMFWTGNVKATTLTLHKPLLFLWNANRKSNYVLDLPFIKWALLLTSVQVGLDCKLAYLLCAWISKNVWLIKNQWDMMF